MSRRHERLRRVLEVRRERPVPAAASKAAFTSSTVASPRERHDEVGDRAGRDRGANRDPVDLALQVRQHEADRPGGAGRRRDQVDRRGAGAAEVLVRAGRGCWSFVYAWIVVMNPRSIPNESSSTFAIGATQFVVHEAFEMIECFSASYASSLTPSTSVMSGSVAGAEMTTFFAPASRCFCASSRVREEARRLDHDVDLEVAPGQVRRIALRKPCQRGAVHLQRPAFDLDVTVEVPERRVVLQEVRHRRDVAEVVERDDLEVPAAVERSAKEVAADPAESVDPHPCLRHGGDSSERC